MEFSFSPFSILPFSYVLGRDLSDTLDGANGLNRYGAISRRAAEVAVPAALNAEETEMRGHRGRCAASVQM